MKKVFKTVDAYIADQPEDMQRVLSTLRATIQKTVPDAVEIISYGMPAYKLHGRVLMYFAGWAEHYAIYPGSLNALAELADEVAPYKVTKGTIRFEREMAVPVALIKKIASLRKREVEQQIAAKREKP